MAPVHSNQLEQSIKSMMKSNKNKISKFQQDPIFESLTHWFLV